MKTKIYLQDINETVNEKFNNATLQYPQAHKDNTKPGCSIAYITEGSDFIAIGKGDECKGELKTFKNWDDAAEYAKTLTGDYVIGIRPAGKQQYTIVATVKPIVINYTEYVKCGETKTELINKTWAASNRNKYDAICKYFETLWAGINKSNTYHNQAMLRQDPEDAIKVVENQLALVVDSYDEEKEAWSHNVRVVKYV